MSSWTSCVTDRHARTAPHPKVLSGVLCPCRGRHPRRPAALGAGSPPARGGGPLRGAGRTTSRRISALPAGSAGERPAATAAPRGASSTPPKRKGCGWRRSTSARQCRRSWRATRPIAAGHWSALRTYVGRIDDTSEATEQTRTVEKAHYEREARLAFGHAGRSTVQSVSQASTPSMGQEIDEAKRLAAKHDPSRQSACRLCGQTTGRDWDRGRRVETVPLLSAVAPRWSGRRARPSPRSTRRAERGGRRARLRAVAEPGHFPGKWPSVAGQEHPWGHLPEDFAARGPEALAQVRRLRDPSPEAQHLRIGLCVVRCQSLAAGDRRPMARRGRGRQARRWALCAQCHPWALRAGAYSGHHWRCHLLAACVGMRRPSWDYDLGLKAFFESGHDRAGTEAPWEYLGPLHSRLREARVLREHPASSCRPSASGVCWRCSEPSPRSTAQRSPPASWQTCRTVDQAACWRVARPGAVGGSSLSSGWMRISSTDQASDARRRDRCPALPGGPCTPW